MNGVGEGRQSLAAVRDPLAGVDMLETTGVQVDYIQKTTDSLIRRINIKKWSRTELGWTYQALYSTSKLGVDLAVTRVLPVRAQVSLH
jgi:hypothetical protein